jgi:NAD(P)-dependent dehydrogenase (short-subunit alcohol dehydrogenase family)
VYREITASGVQVLAVTGDISKVSDIKNLVEKTIERFGPPDILVNNASITKRSLLVESDDDVWTEVIHTNLIGNYLMTKYFLKTMIPRKTGRIINIASVAGKTGHPFNSSYAASKHGILGLTRTAAMEMGIIGVPGLTVNAICPGATKTDMLTGEDGYFKWVSQKTGESKETIEKRLVSLNIQGRMLDPEEIAELAVYLASDEARGVTGQAISVDGGQVMC